MTDIFDTVYPAWHANAACHPDRGHDPATWFPSAEGNGRRSEVSRPAIKICNGCPVRFRCLHDAKTRGEVNGIWGGVDFEAQARKAGNGRPQCGTEAGYYWHIRNEETACDACRSARLASKKGRRSA